MKYPYTIKLVDDYDPDSIILDLPEEVNLFAAFLFDAIKDQTGADKCFAVINQVFSGLIEKGEFYGDIYKATIEKGNTVVEDMEDYEKYHSYMRTSDFEELIKDWMIEKNKRLTSPS
jgi:hypothetical protein